MFYGWYIVAAIALLSIYQSGTFAYGFTAFIAPIAATFGWSYAQISLAVSFRGLETGALDPFVGVVADRWPARRLMLIGVSIIGLGTLCISQATNLATFYAGFLVGGVGLSMAMHIVPRVTMAKWFKKDIGKASGIVAVGLGTGGVLLPVLVRVIDTYGWQTSLLIIAVGTWILGIPLSLVFRTRPEDHGLLPDGKLQDDVKAPSSSDSYDLSTGVREVVKMRAFWHIGLAFMLQTGARTAVMTHIMPYFASLGIARSTASMIAMLVPLVSLAPRMGYGWLADIFPKKSIVATSSFLMSAGLFLFWLIDGSSFGLIIAFVVIFGLGMAGAAPLSLPITREYFGTKRLGTILGLIGIFNMAGLVVSPPLAGWVFDTLGVYDPVWLTLSATTMIGVILMSTAPHPPRN